RNCLKRKAFRGGASVPASRAPALTNLTITAPGGARPTLFRLYPPPPPLPPLRQIARRGKEPGTKDERKGSKRVRDRFGKGSVLSIDKSVRRGKIDSILEERRFPIPFILLA